VGNTCPETAPEPLLDQFLREDQNGIRDGKAERLGGLEVDHHLDFCDLLHREVGRLVALENAPGIDASLVVLLAEAAAIAHQTAGEGVLTIWEHRG
jgi:hypothetical protein